MSNNLSFMFTKEEILKKENEFLKNENEILKKENEILKNKFQYISHNINNLADYMKIHGVNETSILEESMLDENNTAVYQYQFNKEFEEKFWKSLEDEEEYDETCCNTSICINDEVQEKFWKTFEENETYYSENICMTDDEYTDIMSDISDDEIQEFWKN